LGLALDGLFLPNTQVDKAVPDSGYDFEIRDYRVTAAQQADAGGAAIAFAPCSVEDDAPPPT
jgi:hypothetical protein